MAVSAPVVALVVARAVPAAAPPPALVVLLVVLDVPAPRRPGAGLAPRPRPAPSRRVSPICVLAAAPAGRAGGTRPARRVVAVRQPVASAAVPPAARAAAPPGTATARTPPPLFVLVPAAIVKRVPHRRVLRVSRRTPRRPAPRARPTPRLLRLRVVAPVLDRTQSAVVVSGTAGEAVPRAAPGGRGDADHGPVARVRVLPYREGVCRPVQ